MKIKVSFFGLLMLFSLVVTHSYLSLSAIVAAFFHELGHLTVARVCDVPIEELKLDIFGAAISLKKDFCSYKKELAVALGGPAVNFLSFFIFFPFFDGREGFFKLFLAASLFLGILNLLPIEGFDGGRVIYCILSEKMSLASAYRISRVLSAMCISSLWVLSVYLMLRTSASLAMFVFSFSLLCKLFLKRENKD